ncbi:MAG: hypothetical protein IH597_08935 [Bacteroidales bacterium]|nr:hypothetical protein [Bacteroidales bacterium]
MHQLSINFETAGHEPLTPAPTARQLRSMYYENMIQASTLNRELRRQDTAQRNAEAKAWESKMDTWVPEDQKAEDHLDLITAKADRGKPLSKTDLKIIESLFLPDILRNTLIPEVS